MFVLMLNGHPISTRLPDDLGFDERFWYWRGTSGQSYIHSIYGQDSCPPLPGAVFIAVRRVDGQRRPVAVGRFPVMIEGGSLDISTIVPELHLADEVHVHLLARDSASAERVFMDLKAALDGTEEALAAMRAVSLRKPVQLELIAA